MILQWKTSIAVLAGKIFDCSEILCGILSFSTKNTCCYLPWEILGFITWQIQFDTQSLLGSSELVQTAQDPWLRPFQPSARAD